MVKKIIKCKLCKKKITDKPILKCIECAEPICLDCYGECEEELCPDCIDYSDDEISEEESNESEGSYITSEESLEGSEISASGSDSSLSIESEV